MSVCPNCGTVVPSDAKFCPICGAAIPTYVEPTVPDLTLDAPAPAAAAAAAEEQSAPQAAPSWYESAPHSEQSYQQPPVVPVTPLKPSIGSILDFYRQAFEILKRKPIRLWGLSLLYALIASLISMLGAAVPLISLPIVMVLQLGFTGVLPVMNVIKFYSYCLVPYILLTDKEISPTEALRKSMRMTDGYKGKMFGADILLMVGIWVVMLVLGLLMQIPYIGFLFGIVFFLVYLAICLFGTIFYGLVHTAIFEKIREVNND